MKSKQNINGRASVEFSAEAHKAIRESGLFQIRKEEHNSEINKRNHRVSASLQSLAPFRQRQAAQ